jgi:hypothetical protein
MSWTNARRLRALGDIQATVSECAAVLGCAKSTLAAYFNAHEEARTAYEDGKLAGLVSLRRKQFAMAEKNVAMAIWLGKQFLGQREPVQQVEHGDAGEFDRMTTQELRSVHRQRDRGVGLG